MGEKGIIDVWLDIDQDDEEAMWNSYINAKSAKLTKQCKIAMITSVHKQNPKRIAKDIQVIGGNDSKDLEECVKYFYRDSDYTPVLAFYTEKRENLRKFIKADKPADIFAGRRKSGKKNIKRDRI